MRPQIELLHSNELDPAILWPPLESNGRGRRTCDFVHIAVMHGGGLAIVPRNPHRIPTRFSDDATIGSIASPINAGALLEALRFVGFHCCSSDNALTHIVRQELVAVLPSCFAIELLHFGRSSFNYRSMHQLFLMGQ